MFIEKTIETNLYNTFYLLHFFYQHTLLTKLFVGYILGNLLVIITIMLYMNRENVTNIFITNLSISDLLVITYALPLRVSIFPHIQIYKSNNIINNIVYI